MAKKKEYEVPKPKKDDFAGLVESSFNDGYESEPEIEAPDVSGKPAAVAAPSAPSAPSVPPVETRPLTEQERYLKAIREGDKDALSSVWAEKERYTFYVSAMLRACIEIVSYNEKRTKTDVIEEAFKNFFSDDVKEAARERAVVLAIKDLEQKIKKGNEKNK